MRILFPLLILAFVSQPALSQEEEPRTCRILFISPAADSPKTLHLFDGQNSREVDLPSLNLSKVYHLPPGRLNLQLLKDPVVDPELIPKGAPSVAVPENMQHIYLLVCPDPENKVAPVKIVLINANYDEIGRGEMLWFNLTNSQVTGKLGIRKFTIKPGQRALVKEPTRKNENYPVEIYFQIPGDDFIHPLCETQWRHNPRSRSIVLLLKDGNRKAPRIRSFSDFRLPEKTDQSDAVDP